MSRVLLFSVLVAASSWAKPPKLTLVISVDAFGSELMQRHRPQYKAGLKRFFVEGAVFPQCTYELAETVTAIGHATLATGAYPHRHGIVGNRVFNRSSGKNEAVFADGMHPVLGAPTAVEDASPIALRAETLSDRLRTATALKGKSVTISGKGRASVALAGRLGDAWWFHEQVGQFVTGTWYKKEFPTWVSAFNDKKLPDEAHGKRWELLEPPTHYVGDDDRPFEADVVGLGKVFPHSLTGGLPSPGPQSYAALASSPMMNDLLVTFAKAAIEGEALGRDDVPDLLQVSFSAFDRTYHLYGPTSWEVQDSVLRLDRAIADLLSAAEKAAGGKANLVVLLSADHGGANIPEEWASLGLPGLRVSPAALHTALDEELGRRFGGAGLVASIEEVDVYLNQTAIEQRKLDGATVRRAAAEIVRRRPELFTAVARDDLPTLDAAGIGPWLRNGFFPDTSGDVLMVMRPYHVLESEKAGTSHGTPWRYDSDVPLMLLGRGIKPAVYVTQAHPIDLAPTAAALMELGAPNMSEGRVLWEAIAPGRE